MCAAYVHAYISCKVCQLIELHICAKCLFTVHNENELSQHVEGNFSVHRLMCFNTILVYTCNSVGSNGVQEQGGRSVDV